MLAGIALIVWGYALARLFQVPAELPVENQRTKAWIILCSVLGIIVATVGLLLTLSSGLTGAGALRGLQGTTP
jgi:hypothetical protein